MKMPGQQTRLLLLTAVTLVGAVISSPVMLGPAIRQSDGSQKYTISFTMPNVTLVSDDVFLCMAVRVPGHEMSFINQVEAKPVPGVKSFLFIQACEGTDMEIGASGVSDLHDCGLDAKASLNPPFARARGCLMSGGPASGHGTFQYQGGSEEESRLRLPEGTGIPAGGDSGHGILIFGSHYPMRPANHMTGNARLKLTLTKKATHVKRVATISFVASGLVGEKREGSVTGSWTLDQDISIHVLRLHPHAHGMAIRNQVRIERKDGESDVILDQDPRSSLGIRDVAGLKTAYMNLGDTLKFTCTYNNTMSRVLRVWDGEMCVLRMYYSVEGNQTLDTNSVSSHDPMFGRCISDFPPKQGFQVNYDAVSSSPGVTRCPPSGEPNEMHHLNQRVYH